MNTFGPGGRLASSSRSCTPSWLLLGVLSVLAVAALLPGAAWGASAPSRRMPSAPISSSASLAAHQTTSLPAASLGVFPSSSAAAKGPLTRAHGKRLRLTRAQRRRQQRLARRLLARRRAYLRSRRARRQRAVSKIAFRSLGSAAALRAMETAAPGVTTSPVWQPPRLRAGERILAYNSDTSALIDEPGSKVNTLMDSTGPLLAPSAHGGATPMDMTLQDIVAGGWRPAATATPLTIGGTLGAGISMSGAAGTTTVHPAGAAATAGTEEHGKVFYANAQADTDVIVDPTPTGMSVAWTLRSAASPQDLSLTVDLPAGASLVQDGPGLDIVRAGETVATVDPPAAFDAQNTPVPVSYRVDGDVIHVVVPHRGRDLAYPVAVDPVFENSGVVQDGWVDPDTGAKYPEQSGFTWGVGGNAAGLSPGVSGPTLYMRAEIGAHDGSAGWMMQPQNGSVYYTRADFESMHMDADPDACSMAGLYNWNSGNPYGETAYGAYSNAHGSGSAPGIFTNCGGFGDASYITTCASATCDYNVGTGGNDAGVQMLIGHQNNVPGTTYFNGGYFFIRDRDNPSISSVTVPSGWIVNNNLRATIVASDAGVGIGQDPDLSYAPFYSVIPSLAGNSPVAFPDTGVPQCEGTVTDRCPNGATTASMLWDGLPQGQYALRFYVQDLIGHQSYVDKTVSIDSVGPDIGLTGQLASIKASNDAAVRAGAPPRSVSRKTRLHVTGDDVYGGAIVSGVKSVTVTASQGSTSHSVTSTTVVNGQVNMNYDFDPTEWAPGPVTISVTSVDNAGNASRDPQTFTIAVARGEISTLLEGQATAKRLVLQARNVRPDLPSPTSVTWEYRIQDGTGTQFAPINSNLQTISGTPLSPGAQPMTNGVSQQVVWNVADALPGNTKPVIVIGLFSNGPGDTTNDVLTNIDSTGMRTDDKDSDVGAGTVDDLTGNFSMTADDVSIATYRSPFGVSRTYDSRAPLTVDTTKPYAQPFGPGWSLGLPVTDDQAVYTKVVELGPSTPNDDSDDGFGIATVTTNDGSDLDFEQHPADNDYYSLPDLGELHLHRLTDPSDPNGPTTGFSLDDTDSNETLYFAADGVPGEYKLSSIHAASSDVTTTLIYGTDNAARKQFVSDILAPVGSGVDCSSLDNTGCRSLHLRWDPAGDGTMRVTGVWFKEPGSELPSGGVQVAAYDYVSGRLVDEYDPRLGSSLMTRYAYDGNGHMATITPPGEQPWTLAYAPQGAEAATVGRLATISRQVPVGTSQTLTPAKRSVVYGVALSGSGAPYDMSPSTLATWSQDDDIPTDAAAIFRPDDPQTGPPSSYARATVHYLDALGRETNEARPGGEITTTEHDAAGDPVRELTAANRAWALGTRSTAADAICTATATACRADLLSTSRVFNEESGGTGYRLVDEKDPIHSTRLANGTTVSARKHVQIAYDAGQPTTEMPDNLPTSSIESAYVPTSTSAGTDTDARYSTMAYDWTLKLPTVRTVDARDPTNNPSGLNLQTKTEYNGQGLPTYQEQPSSGSETGASTRRTIYYTAGTNSDDSACGNKPLWVDMPCKVTAGGAPTGSLPSLPVSVFEYDAYDHQTKKTDYVDGISRRVAGAVYTNGRLSSQTVTGTTGDARPEVDYGYSSTTGRLLRTTAQSSPAKVITRVYDAAGQISSYTDSDSGRTSTVYDVDGRPTTVTDDSGSRAFSYDATTGRVSSLNDSGVGVITPAWTADGDLSSELFATANVKLAFTRDETDTVTGRSYVDQAPCSTSCTVYSDSATRSIHDQWLTETGTDKTRTYTYDGAGRLTSSSDAPGGTACVTKTYTYDADGDRLSRRTYPAGTGGACTTSTTPTTQTLTYDQADRLNNTGYVYDTLGRITTVPAGDAGGANALTNTYYLDDRAHTLTQGGTTTTLDLDPSERVRSRTVGAGTATISHYGDDTDSPAWTTQGTTVVHNSTDAGGDLVATVGPSAGSGGSGTWTGPTTSVLDNFNRADGSLGSSWTTLTGTGASTISSNQVKLSTSAWGYDWWNANSFTGDGEVYMTVPGVSTGTNDQIYLDIVSGWSTGNLNGYELTVNRGSSVDAFQMTKYTNGSETTIGTYGNLSGHLGAGDKIALTRQAGGKIKMWREASGSSTWTQVGSTVTDTSFFDSGQSWQIGFGASTSTYRMDDFGGGQITVSSGTGSTRLDISDLQGDVVSTVPNSTGATTSLLSPVDVFGAPTTAAGANAGYGFLGVRRRNTALSTGTVEMGQRLYQPQIGRFLQPDPVFGGSLNTYDYANQDPAGQFDPLGTCAFDLDLLPEMFVNGNYFYWQTCRHGRRVRLNKIRLRTVQKACSQSAPDQYDPGDPGVLPWPDTPVPVEPSWPTIRIPVPIIEFGSYHKGIGCPPNPNLL
jgi:RHS repeat-associated protein